MVWVNKQPVAATSKLVTAEKAPERGRLHGFAQWVRPGWHCPPGARPRKQSSQTLTSDSLRRRPVREADAGTVWEGTRSPGHLSCRRWEGEGRGLGRAACSLQGAPGTSGHTIGSSPTARPWQPFMWHSHGEGLAPALLAHGLEGEPRNEFPSWEPPETSSKALSPRRACSQ